MTIHLGWALLILLLNSEPADFTHAVVAVVRKQKKQLKLPAKNPQISAKITQIPAKTRKSQLLVEH